MTPNIGIDKPSRKTYLLRMCKVLNLFWLVVFSVMMGCTSKTESFTWRHLANPHLLNLQGKEITHSTADPFWVGSKTKFKMRVSEKKILDQDQLEKLFFAEDLSIKSPYTLHPVPYAGPITAKSSCSEKVHPRFVVDKKNVKQGYVIPSNDRFSVGLCDPEQVTGLQLRFVIYCEGSNIAYQVKIFVEGKETKTLDEIFNTFACHS